MTTQIAVKLPDEMVSAVDRLVASSELASRSEAVRSGLQRLLDDQANSAIDRAFVEGFRRQPTTPAESALATELALSAIEEEPWEKWW